MGVTKVVFTHKSRSSCCKKLYFSHVARNASSIRDRARGKRGAAVSCLYIYIVFLLRNSPTFTLSRAQKLKMTRIKHIIPYSLIYDCQTRLRQSRICVICSGRLRRILELTVTRTEKKMC